MRRWFLSALLCSAWAVPAHAQVRTPDQVFSDIDLLFEILQAVVMRVDVDDPEVSAAQFPGRTLPPQTSPTDGRGGAAAPSFTPP